MTPAKATLLAVIGVGVILALSMGGCVLGTLNSEADLRVAIPAKSTANEATLDTMWKTIKQKAQITEKAAGEIKDMNKIYTELVEGRSGGTLMKMVTENYPDLGQKEVTKLYMEIMASVEAERKVFKRDQQALVDLVRERDQLLTRPVSGLILSMFGGRDATMPFYKRAHPECPSDHPEKFTYMFVTSRDTKVMVDTGEENDIDLFGGDK